MSFLNNFDMYITEITIIHVNKRIYKKLIIQFIENKKKLIFLADQVKYKFSKI